MTKVELMFQQWKCWDFVWGTLKKYYKISNYMIVIKLKKLKAFRDTEDYYLYHVQNI